MSEHPVARPPGAVLDERYGRRPPIAGFIGRAAVVGVAAGLLGTLLTGVVVTAASDWQVWTLLLYGFALVCAATGAVGALSAVAGLLAARFGRTARGRTALLAVTGGAAAAVQLDLLARSVLGGPGASHPVVIAILLVSAALGGALLVRLRHRTLRQALRLRRSAAPAR